MNSKALNCLKCTLFLSSPFSFFKKGVQPERSIRVSENKFQLNKEILKIHRSGCSRKWASVFSSSMILTDLSSGSSSRGCLAVRHIYVGYKLKKLRLFSSSSFLKPPVWKWETFSSGSFSRPSVNAGSSKRYLRKEWRLIQKKNDLRTLIPLISKDPFLS